ncbi:TetR family transcriptional regulator [Mycolicibacterium conceptionense]|uniref:TetR family transcriptional regulator n=1 Tax=Mycolicibacterium conceptionense TaxID=451644 RepID=A0A0U1D298_9MYCO|nr:TetR family transcriptional regulator [Mycolicibacterium conceptionense]OBF04635.1 TetR family transcriptional regulator [Mycolicibacterium conceptionense]OBF17057.1 TetR family transcriptional regulator [Mycolicibacterium conceptionense]OBF43048.1 TetR family transcriptional regulator [Mycolicibacterium conceptionense]OBI00867.1 TetR family transcriptional regulator [Mycolicibacterium conceptionense]
MALRGSPRNQNGEIRKDGAVARPNRQAQRREEILEAAITLIERHDLATLRIADVAAELGLTPNAVRYYFREMEELLSELAQRSDSRFYDDRLAVVRRTESARDQLALTIAAGLPSGPEDAEWRAIWRAVLAAGFELHQRRDVQHIYHRQVNLYASILETGSTTGDFTLSAPARDIAMTLMAMEDYLGYRIVARDPDLDRSTALRLMRGYAELATGATLSVPV